MLARTVYADAEYFARLENSKRRRPASFDLVSRVATSPGASLDDVVARIGAAAVSEDLTTARDMLDRIVEARRAAPARIPRHERAHLFSDPYEGAPDPTKVSSDGEQLADAEPSDADPAATDATAALEALAARVARCRLTAGLFTGKPPIKPACRSGRSTASSPGRRTRCTS